MNVNLWLSLPMGMSRNMTLSLLEEIAIMAIEAARLIKSSNRTMSQIKSSIEVSVLMSMKRIR